VSDGANVESRKCAECGYPIAEEFDQPERKPCPRCGSTRRDISASVNLTAEVRAAIRAEVERGLNDVRLAVLGILVTIGLTVGLSVGFGIPSAHWGVVAGIGSLLLAAALIWEPRSRNFLMEMMHRLTGH
jgi:hypothetical protein